MSDNKKERDIHNDINDALVAAGFEPIGQSEIKEPNTSDLPKDFDPCAMTFNMETRDEKSSETTEERRAKCRAKLLQKSSAKEQSDDTYKKSIPTKKVSQDMILNIAASKKQYE